MLAIIFLYNPVRLEKLGTAGVTTVLLNNSKNVKKVSNTVYSGHIEKGLIPKQKELFCLGSFLRNKGKRKEKMPKIFTIFDWPDAGCATAFCPLVVWYAEVTKR